MVLWAGRMDRLAEAWCSRMASFTCLCAQMRWLGWLRPLSTSESCPGLFTWWWKIPQQQGRANSKTERSTHQACLCIIFANVPPTNTSYLTKFSFKGWRNRCHLLMAGTVKYCGHIFSNLPKEATLSHLRLSLVNFPGFLKPGFEDIPQRQMSKWWRAGQCHHSYSCPKGLLWRNQDIAGIEEFLFIFY